jgi:hypothetical protein
VHSKWGLMCSALAGASLLALDPAAAQSLSDSEKIERLQRQTEQLQKQLKALQEEIALTKKKTEKVEAAQAKEAAPAGHAAPTPDREPTKSPLAKAPAWTDKVKITLGGFVTADSVFRARNQVNDIGTNFTQIPYPFSPLYGEHEFHGSARQSRLSLLVEGNITPVQKLSGYWESDFLGVATNSNYIETNSWAMRMRHAYVTYDNTAWGFHLLGGQSWSLLTQNTVGITPRKENIPLTIDADYVDGFNYTRNWQIRLVQDFGQKVWLGVSVETPATVDNNVPAGVTGTPAMPVTVNGLEINAVNTATSGFLQTVAVTPDHVPDVIEKAAFDPGWGHYEVFGIERWFSDNTFCAVSTPTGCAVGTTNLKTSFGAAVGGSVLLPLIPKYLDAQASVMYGRGIGRYGAGQLPDVTIAADGSLAPVTVLQTMVGLVGHPWESLDVYAYGGIEQAKANFFNGVGNNPGSTPFGYGNPAFDNSGCNITTGASFAAPAPATTPANCIANNRRLLDGTVGFWYNLYKGPLGRVATGAEYEYIRREAFNGIGGAPSTANHIILTSLRYYPF